MNRYFSLITFSICFISLSCSLGNNKDKTNDINIDTSKIELAKSDTANLLPKKVSKDETIQWLQTKLNSYAIPLEMHKSSRESRFINYDFKIRDNKLYVTSIQDNSDPALVIKWSEEVLITDIKKLEFWNYDKNIKAGKYGNSARIVVTTKILKTKNKFSPEEVENNQGDIWFGFRCDAEDNLEERLNNAFNNLREIIKTENQAF